MAREENTEKSEQELRERAWELADDIGFCMFATWDGERQARPMHAHVDKDTGSVFFLTDVDGGKIEELEQFPKSLITFSESMKVRQYERQGDGVERPRQDTGAVRSLLEGMVGIRRKIRTSV